jgi:pyruvate dehydrogenase E1 component beta subunit
MREITFAQALGEAVFEEMEKDPTIFTYGEDIAKQGGVYRHSIHHSSDRKD